jgi:hypothetical protein
MSWPDRASARQARLVDDELDDQGLRPKLDLLAHARFRATRAAARGPASRARRAGRATRRAGGAARARETPGAGRARWRSPAPAARRTRSACVPRVLGSLSEQQAQCQDGCIRLVDSHFGHRSPPRRSVRRCRFRLTPQQGNPPRDRRNSPRPTEQGTLGTATYRPSLGCSAGRAALDVPGGSLGSLSSPKSACLADRGTLTKHFGTTSRPGA